MSVQGLKLLLRRAFASTYYYSGALQLRQSQPKILMYHRITSPELCGHALQPGMFVRPETFAMQMEYLAKHCTVVPLESFVGTILAGKPLGPRTVALTFDDGWKDNYDFAFPVLRDHSLPATIFLATSFIGTELTLWSDELPQALTRLQQSFLRKKTSFAFDRSDARPELQALLNQAIKIVTAPRETFIARLDTFVNEVKQVPLELRSALIQILTEQANSLSTESEATRRAFLSWSECREMAAAGISFGNHTHRHEALDTLDEGAIRQELTDSESSMQSNGIPRSSVFCCPEGRYCDTSQALLHASGYQANLGVHPRSDLHATPPIFGRVGIHQDINWTKPLFATRIWAVRT